MQILLCCVIARKASNCKTIARVRNPIYNMEIEFLRKELGLAMVINPELTSAAEIARIFQFPSAVKIDTFSKGRIELLHFRVTKDCLLNNYELIHIRTRLKCDVLVCMVTRGDQVLIPRGDFVVLEGLFDKQRYDFFLLREEPYLGICAAGHPFAGKQIPIPDLFSERLILREEGSGTRKILERELTQSGYHVSAFSDCACISSFKLLKELVRENCGISFVYEAVVKDDPRFGRFYCPPLTAAHELNVVYLKNTDAGHWAHQFLEK